MTPPTVEVFTRHTADCPKAENRNWKRCKCPKWLYWRYENTAHRRSAKTRSWEKAQGEARKIEARFEQPGEPDPQADVITLEHAVRHYLADKKSQQVGDQWYGKLEQTFIKQL